MNDGKRSKRIKNNKQLATKCVVIKSPLHYVLADCLYVCPGQALETHVSFNTRYDSSKSLMTGILLVGYFIIKFIHRTK